MIWLYTHQFTVSSIEIGSPGTICFCRSLLSAIDRPFASYVYTGIIDLRGAAAVASNRVNQCINQIELISVLMVFACNLHHCMDTNEKQKKKKYEEKRKMWGKREKKKKGKRETIKQLKG